MQNISLFIFDCDGVLVDSEPLSAAAHVTVYARHGVTVDEALMRDCVGMKQLDIVQLVKQRTGFELPQSDIPLIWQEMERIVEHKLKPTLRIGDFLSGLGETRCVASSSDLERIKRSLRITHLDGLFQPERIFSSSMVQRGKPAPDLFLHAAAACGHQPKQCLVFEDSVYGVQAGLAAGMRVIGYTGGSHSDASHAPRLRHAGAEASFDSWEEIGRYLRA